MYTADLRLAIGAAMPSIIEAVKDGEWFVQEAAIELVIRLAQYG